MIFAAPTIGYRQICAGVDVPKQEKPCRMFY
jgi:hypothetical protein